jgi:hypothetical protein
MIQPIDSDLVSDNQKKWNYLLSLFRTHERWKDISNSVSFQELQKKMLNPSKSSLFTARTHKKLAEIKKSLPY